MNARYNDVADVEHLKPESLALIRSTGSDATVVVELWGADQKPIRFGSLPYISLTISNTAKSLVSFIGASWPDASVVGGRLLVASGSAVRYNFAAVDGNLEASLAPTTSSPGLLNIGEALLFGRFDGVAPDGTSRVTISDTSPGFDATNDRVMAQPKATMGSGGAITGDGVLHSGACTLLGLNFHCTTAGTIAIADATAGGGTTLFTVTGVANQSQTVLIPGLAFGTGIYADFTTYVGSISAFIGPAVA